MIWLPSCKRRSRAVLLFCASLFSYVGCSSTAIRPGETVETRYQRTDGLVGDLTTGLMWTADSNFAKVESQWAGLTWDEALRFISEMNQGERPNLGYNDWRLPRVEELSVLTTSFWRCRTGMEELGRALRIGAGLGAGQDLTRVNELPFDNIEATAYWTGTSVQDRDGRPSVGEYRTDSTAPRGDNEAGRAWAVDTGGTCISFGQNRAQATLAGARQ